MNFTYLITDATKSHSFVSQVIELPSSSSDSVEESVHEVDIDNKMENVFLFNFWSGNGIADKEEGFWKMNGFQRGGREA